METIKINKHLTDLSIKMNQVYDILTQRLQVKVKRLSDDAIIPTKAHVNDAAFDLYIPHDIDVKPQCRQVIPLEIAIELPEGYCAEIQPRSGYASKGMEGYCGFSESVRKFPLSKRRYNADVIYGLIDPNYRGGIGVILHNLSSCGFVLLKGMRIAQLVIRRVEKVEFIEVEELSKTERNDKAFGSSNE